MRVVIVKDVLQVEVSRVVQAYDSVLDLAPRIVDRFQLWRFAFRGEVRTISVAARHFFRALHRSPLQYSLERVMSLLGCDDNHVAVRIGGWAKDAEQQVTHGHGHRGDDLAGVALGAAAVRDDGGVAVKRRIALGGVLAGALSRGSARQRQRRR